MRIPILTTAFVLPRDEALIFSPGSGIDPRPPRSDDCHYLKFPLMGACNSAGRRDLFRCKPRRAEYECPQDVGLVIVFQESFGPDPRLAQENFEKLTTKIAGLRERETPLVNVGVSPHAPYTVCSPQLRMISRFALDEKLPVMMHAAETEMEVSFLREGRGPFAEGLRSRGLSGGPEVSTFRSERSRVRRPGATGHASCRRSGLEP